MADYYPLLARALDALPDRSVALREAVYGRARSALIGQLRSLEPPLSEADIELERDALETAIARLERDHGEPADQPAPDPPAPTLPAPPMPPAPAPDLGAAPEPRHDPPADPVPAREPAVAIQPRRPAEVAPPKPGVDPSPTETGFAAAPAPAETPEAAGSRQRPRVDVVARRGNRSALLRNVFVGGVLALVIGLIAVAAFLLRDKPADLAPAAAGPSGTAVEGAESKYADRIGEPASPARAPVQESPSPIPAQPEVAVAQRATLYEENTGDPNAPPAAVQGRVVWRLESLSGEQGQPLETALRGLVTFPDAGLALTLTIRRNLDATLPASHTIELAFANTPPAGDKHAVQDVGLLQAKDEENARGSPVSGLPVRVRENLFLIGLSSLPADVERNTDLLLRRNWFDLAVKFTAGPRAIVTFEKGTSGADAMQAAFAQWKP